MELINGDLAQMVGIGPLTTTCDEVSEPEVGTEFGCQSTSGDNQTIEWGVLVDRNDHIDVHSQNVVLQSTLEILEQDAVAVLYGDNPLGVAIDCGESSRILDGTGSMLCDAAAPAEPSVVHDATFTFTDIDSRAFEVVLSDEPRE